MRAIHRVPPWAALLPVFVAPGAAYAFCGAYVGAAGADLYNEASQIMIARQGTTTTLTLANDYSGELDDFALVIPVPQVLDATQVWTVDEELFTRTDSYSSPRTVSYTCEDAITETHWPSAAGCGLLLGCSESSGLSYEDTGWSAADDGVTVEAEFQVSEYEIVILSAEGGEGLSAWLDANGYAIPVGGEAIFDDYIRGGSYFLAAKIALDALPAGNTWLSPLRFSYQAAVMSLPIRMGTVSSAGEQDLLIYVMADELTGEVGIANYPQLQVDDECMWPGDRDRSFGEWYDGKLQDALDGQDRAGWLTEYSWYQPPPGSASGQKCDPCVVEDLTPVLIQPAELGLPAMSGHFTRIHMRYRPDQVDEDLMFYAKGPSENGQMRYVQYKRELEFLFPLCGQGYAESPGMCGDAWDTESPRRAVSCSAAAAPMAGWLGMLLSLVLLRRRQR